MTDEKKNDFPRFMITWKQLNEFIEGKVKTSKDGEYRTFEADHIDEGVDLSYYASEMSEMTRDSLNIFGFEFDDEGITIDGEGESPMIVLEKVACFSVLVFFAYDGCDMISTDVEGHCRMNNFIGNFIWNDLLGMSSDGDVDYNGSYLDILVDVVRDYLMR